VLDAAVALGVDEAVVENLDTKGEAT